MSPFPTSPPKEPGSKEAFKTLTGGLPLHIESPVRMTFMHSPKTGGTSVKEWFLEETDCEVTFGSGTKHHVGYPHIKNEFERLGLVVTIVRNPWSHYFSLWRNFVWDSPIERYKPPFDIFMALSFHCEHYRRPWPWEDFLNYADIVLRFEHLQEDFKLIQELVGVKAPLPYRNVRSNQLDYRNYYTQNMIDDVYREHKLLIDTYGYNYGD